MRHHPIPEGYRAITPYLKLPDAGRLVDYLKAAFGAAERGRLAKPDGTLLHAELMIDDSLVMVHEAPEGWPARPSTLYLYVEDVDRVFERAVKAGGTPLKPPTDTYYGDRVAWVSDVSDNHWWIASRLESPAIDELQQRAEEYVNARDNHQDGRS